MEEAAKAQEISLGAAETCVLRGGEPSYVRRLRDMESPSPIIEFDHRVPDTLSQLFGVRLWDQTGTFNSALISDHLHPTRGDQSLGHPLNSELEQVPAPAITFCGIPLLYNATCFEIKAFRVGLGI